MFSKFSRHSLQPSAKPYLKTMLTILKKWIGTQKQRLLYSIIRILYLLLFYSWRTKHTLSESCSLDFKKKRPLIFALNHTYLLSSLYTAQKYNVSAMISPSKDGEFLVQILKPLGVNVIRASSSRDGARGLIQFIRLMRTQPRTALTIDGPRGPLHVVKPGIFELAKRTGAIIYPVGIANSKYCVIHRAWDKTQIPWPFAKISIVFGEPFLYDRNSTRPLQSLPKV